MAWPGQPPLFPPGFQIPDGSQHGYGWPVQAPQPMPPMGMPQGPNYMNSLAMGLRSAAGVLNPQIQTQLMQQDQQRMEMMERRKTLVAQQIIKAAEMGAISPEAAQAHLQKLGLGDIPIGPSLEAQKQKQAIERETAMRRDLESGMDPRKVAMKYASPSDILKMKTEAGGAFTLNPGAIRYDAQGNEIARGGEKPSSDLTGLPDSAKLLTLRRQAEAKGDREAVSIYDNMLNVRQQPAMQERQLGVLRELSGKAARGVPISDEERRNGDAVVAGLSQTRVFTDPVTQQVYQIPPMKIPDSLLTWRRGAPAAAPGTGAAQTPSPTPLPLPTSGGRKQLDAATENKVNQMGNSYNMQKSLYAGFDPSYGGWKFDTVGEAAIAFKRRFGDETKMADWWQNYRQWVIDIRNEKFGATLTGNELRAFNDIVARPSDDPKVIQQNLTRQIQIIEGAISRQIGSLEKEGYNKDAILQRLTVTPIRTGKTAIPGAATPTPVAAPAPGGVPASSVVNQNLPQVQSDADYAKVPAGSQYIAPDGSVRTKGAQ